MKEQIIEEYLNIVKEKGSVPSMASLIDRGVSRDRVRSHFGNLTNLHAYIRENHSEELDKIFLVGERVFDKDLPKSKRYFVTTIINNKPFWKEALASIRKYCQVKNAVLVLLPCLDIWDRQASGSANNWSFSPEFAEDVFITDDTLISHDVFLSSIKTSAKQINPTTGLARIAKDGKSFIFASPKQTFEVVPKAYSHDNSITFLATTGTISSDSYDTDKYMSERMSYIANNDHCYGGLIVEVDDECTHVRQVQFDYDGSFIDLGTSYSKDGIEFVDTHAVLGDWHSGDTDERCIRAFTDICRQLSVVDVYVHDFFNGHSISHHEDTPLKKAQKYLKDRNSLVKEFQKGAKDFELLLSLVTGKVYRVMGNHEEFLHRYLHEGRYINDPENHYPSLDLAKAYLKDEDPTKAGYELYADLHKLEDYDRIVWLDRYSSVKIGGNELGQHGDLGPNGSKASLISLEKSYGKGVFGHTHSAAILRGIWRVGTFTKNQSYEKGPTSRSHSLCLVYNNGSKQLIHINGDKWCLTQTS